MRKIEIVHSDYDKVSQEKWEFVEGGYLVSQHIVLSRDNTVISFYLYDSIIVEDMQSVNVIDSTKIISFDVGYSVSDIEIERLANMTLAEIAIRLLNEN